MTLLDSDSKCHSEVKESGCRADGAMTQHLLATKLTLWRWQFVILSNTPTHRYKKKVLHRQIKEVTDDCLVFTPYCESTDKCSISAPINSLVWWLEVSGLKKDGLLYDLPLSLSAHSNLKTQMW